MKGTSARNLKYMRAFAEAYPSFMQSAVAQTEVAIVQSVVAQIPWTHNITLLDRVKGHRGTIILHSKDTGKFERKFTFY